MVLYQGKAELLTHSTEVSPLNSFDFPFQDKTQACTHLHMHAYTHTHTHTQRLEMNKKNEFYDSLGQNFSLTKAVIL